MALRFRNIDVTPQDPVSEWGVEGISTAIERGYLPHWRRITRAVRADPDGPVAADLEEALSIVDPDSGAAMLLGQVLADVRRGPEARVARLVRQAVLRSGLSAKEFAAHVGTSPSRLSTYMSGKVVPSAALLLEIQDAGERLSANTRLAAGARAVPV
ncbi:helix-turn-helix transcriptional regulator [Oerskovia sp. KBS0722]|uniref:helix-turn-helix domain-containing protein n=1 Tax=Oerskovia sp. KBS0722 TaxID=1179673 RepID=UPI00110D555D|nr:helix-turn-helix transcriptional regulator [Oerskovia sp. KBS0722]QDW62905.1 helix-turn-helix transcriptional regulator [Oerskovia sp. KBS0722]